MTDSTLALDALNKGRSFLERASVESARRNAEILLSEILGVKSYKIYLERGLALDGSMFQKYRQMIEKRAAGVPIEYIVGNVEFMGLRLSLREGIFIPRPETELLCEIVLEKLERIESPLVADICTGCGPIALTMADCRPDLRCFGTDISEEAIACARDNAQRLGLADRVTFVKGNLLDALKPYGMEGRLDCVVANPPYVRDVDMRCLPVSVREHEPKDALRGGANGTAFYPRIIESARGFLKPGGLIAFEVSDQAADLVSSLLGGAGFSSVESRRDLRKADRFVTGLR